MSEDKTNKNALINLPEIPSSLDNAAKNISDPITQNAGKTLSDIWYLVFGGISQAADKKRMRYAVELEKYHRELEESIDSIPKEKLVEPSVQVAAQALENSKYCIESEELRKMFVNLISKSMHADYSTAVHPSFAEIIKQMSPIDARVLKTIPVEGLFPVVNYINAKKDGSAFSVELSNVYLSNIPDINIFQECTAISSLVRLGIINVNFESYIFDENAYELYNETKYFKQLADTICHTQPSRKADMQKAIGSLTPLGQNFVVTCVL